MSKIILDKRKNGLNLINNEELDNLIVNINEELNNDMLELYASKVCKKGLITLVLNEETFQKSRKLLEEEPNKFYKEIYIEESSRTIIIHNLIDDELAEIETISKILNIIDIIGKEDFNNQMFELFKVDKDIQLGEFVILTDDEEMYKSSSIGLRFLDYKFKLIEIN